MDIKLLTLKLQNFKGIKQLEINFEGKNTNIYGKNATGKTTIFDAFKWLFFDKDSNDRKDFNIKTLDSNNKPIHFLEHSVEAVLLIDGQDTIFKKVFQEKWVKRRGQEQQEFAGHETSYWIDEVPIKKKDYKSEIVIDKSWKELQKNLKRAYMVTIFGYSAPKSDIEAVSMLKEAWGTPEERNLEEIEIIDIRDEDEVILSWKDFIHTHHYSYYNNFFDSTLGRFPRRSCEATFDRLMNCLFLDGDKGFKDGMTFLEIRQKIFPLIEEENEIKGTDQMLKLY